MTHAPTEEQKSIIAAINRSFNCVVIAKPGSGKTFTLAYSIKCILPTLPHYKGIIAISYTNKASDELEERSLSGGLDRKGSFFGTIDKFYLTEIIIPFGRHIFGEPRQEIEVVTLDECECGVDLKPLIAEAEQGNLNNDLIRELQQLYNDGKVLLSTIGCLAFYVFENSFACQRYLNARYSHIFIDEYQDCGQWQHAFFVKLVELGLQGIAVGDINQSIFAFAEKYSRYLIELSQDDERFNTYTLSKNHRSHLSIINYSARLLSSTYIPQPTIQIRVHHKCITGSEVKIAHWLNVAVPHYAERFNITRNKIGILVRGKRTGNLIHQNVNFSHKPIVTTPLDNDSSLWGSVFRKLLNWVFSTEQTKYELVQEYLSIDMQTRSVREVMSLLTQIEAVVVDATADIVQYLGLFTDVADIIFPHKRSDVAISNLRQILSDGVLLDSFIPASENEVQLLTLHKAKGLEFDVVFHLDLYRWILPMYNGDYIQDLNLHYVGITRAKQACILCSSTRRHRTRNQRLQITDAEDSKFLHINSLENLRTECGIQTVL